ncbi:MAG: hypothetical protein DME04_25325 [Candidatus Rokuibacteriota bacterium]|nr:MAG: hypothetical protein DME04_25325 [Candidatus Rokubacteria bacterium]
MSRGDLVQSGHSPLTLRSYQPCVVGVHDETDELYAEEMLSIHQRFPHIGEPLGIDLVGAQELLTEDSLVTF